MITPDNYCSPGDPTWDAFLCGNAILVSEFAWLVQEEERQTVQDFIEKAKAGELESLEDDDIWSIEGGLR